MLSIIIPPCWISPAGYRLPDITCRISPACVEAACEEAACVEAESMEDGSEYKE